MVYLAVVIFAVHSTTKRKRRGVPYGRSDTELDLYALFTAKAPDGLDASRQSVMTLGEAGKAYFIRPVTAVRDDERTFVLANLAH